MKMHVFRANCTPATKRFLEAINNAQDIDISDDPKQLRHSVLFEGRIKEKFSGLEISLCSLRCTIYEWEVIYGNRICW